MHQPNSTFHVPQKGFILMKFHLGGGTSNGLGMFVHTFVTAIFRDRFYSNLILETSKSMYINDKHTSTEWRNKARRGFVIPDHNLEFNTIFHILVGSWHFYCATNMELEKIQMTTAIKDVSCIMIAQAKKAMRNASGDPKKQCYCWWKKSCTS